MVTNLFVPKSWNELVLGYDNNKDLQTYEAASSCLQPKNNLYFFYFSDSDDDEEYWFQNADPKRPKITQPPPAKNLPKRIFHKLEPQVRPTLEQLSPSSLLNNSIQGNDYMYTGLKCLALVVCL